MKRRIAYQATCRSVVGHGQGCDRFCVMTHVLKYNWDFCTAVPILAVVVIFLLHLTEQ